MTDKVNHVTFAHTCRATDKWIVRFDRLSILELINTILSPHYVMCNNRFLLFI